MAYVAAKTHAPLGAEVVLRVVNMFLAAKESIVEWNEWRQTRTILKHLSDAQLDDIGLTRADIDQL